jgi:hypothetical protein
VPNEQKTLLKHPILEQIIAKSRIQQAQTAILFIAFLVLPHPFLQATN